jgi:hypothetical protein
MNVGVLEYAPQCSTIYIPFTTHTEIKRFSMSMGPGVELAYRGVQGTIR